MGLGILDQFAFSVAHEAFIYKEAEVWNLANPVGRIGISNFLRTGGLTPDEIKEVLHEQKYLIAYGADCFPGAQEVVAVGGRKYINTWSPPNLVACEGPYPRIERVLEWLTGGDPAGKKWLVNWLAAKIQDPTFCPKVAVLFTTEEGGGKGTLAYLMSHMLGKGNCETIEAGALQNRFNAKWASKLFVLADEVLTQDSFKDTEDLLKYLITSDTIELEAKGQNQRSIKNRLAFMFASNSTSAPLKLGRSDRRYTVFSNHDQVPEEYTKALLKCFKPDNAPADDFVPEMAGFFFALKNTRVDLYEATRPYKNEARTSLIKASMNSEELFCAAVDEGEVDELLARVKWSDWQLSKSQEEWDFGTDGLSTEVLYQCYRVFCERQGCKPLKKPRFARAITSHRPAWEHTRRQTPDGKRPWCYRVRRTAKGSEQDQSAVAENAGQTTATA